MRIHAGAKNPIKLMRRSRNRTGEPFCGMHPFFLFTTLFWLPRFSSSVTFLASAVFRSCLCFLWRGCGYQNLSPPSLRRREDMDRALMMEETHGMYIKDSTNLSQDTQKKKQQTIFPGDNAPISSLPIPCPSHKISNALPTHIPLPPSVKTDQKHTSHATSKGSYLVPFFFREGRRKTPIPPRFFRSSRQAAARLVLAPALASTAARGPTHRLRTNGIGYP